MNQQSPAKEYITLESGPEQMRVCVCKNTVHIAGFCPCDLQGNEIETPYVVNMDNDYYRCEHCGRVIQSGTLAVVGKWPVDDRPQH